MPSSPVVVAASTFADRIGEVLRRSLPRLGPEARKQVEALLSPESLIIVAAVLTAWVVSHAFGLGEVIDIILLTIGAVALGWAIFEGIDHLYEFAKTTYFAKSSADLDRAAEHFAKAVSILGVQAVVAVLFKGGKTPKTGKGGRISVGSGPTGPGIRYKPKVRQDPTLPAGEGSTSAWGDVRLSTQGSATDRALVLLHEQVHQFLTPKLYFLRNYRVSNMPSRTFGPHCGVTSRRPLLKRSRRSASPASRTSSKASSFRSTTATPFLPRRGATIRPSAERG